MLLFYRYLTDYLSVQEKDFRCISYCTYIHVSLLIIHCVGVGRGHKLMGQVCEKDGKTDKAIVHYNRYIHVFCLPVDILTLVYFFDTPELPWYSSFGSALSCN